MKSYRQALTKVFIATILTTGSFSCRNLLYPIPAFPGAEGYGAESIGGRGGRVVEVTNLSDSGPGSFRSAVTASGRRTVVFRVGGHIEVQRRIDIVDPYLTIAGQTAPGDGVTLRGTDAGNGQMLRIRTHDVIIRHLSIRSGRHGRPGSGQINILLDPIPAEGDRFGDIYNIVLDHLSVSWSLDENIAVFRNVPDDDPDAWPTYPEIYDVSIQHCLIAEGLHPHSTGLQVGGERVVENGRSVLNGGQGVRRLSIHRNLFASNSHRNPSLGMNSARVINNVIYNWSSKAAETHDAANVDWIGNYFKPGPLSTTDHVIVHNDFFKGYPQHRFAAPSIHMSGNEVAGHPRLSNRGLYSIHYEDTPLPESYRRPEPLPPARITVRSLPAKEAFQLVLADVGSRGRMTHWAEFNPALDDVDARIVTDVLAGAGPSELSLSGWTYYSDPEQAGGYAELTSPSPYLDKDRDGLADEWERCHDLNPAVANSSSQDTDGDGYTDLEEFLNQTDPRRYTR